MRRVTAIGVLALLGLFVPPVTAQIAVSSNDNKAVWVDGVNTVPPNPKPDTVTVLDLGATPPRVIATLDVPGGWSAPPQSVAVTPDESLALVASGAKLDPADPKKTVFNDALTVVDLTTRPPRVIATLQTGRRAAGVSINRTGTLALVANRAEGTVSVFTIAGKTVAPAGKVDLGAPESGPSLPVFTPDGRRALVTLNNANRIALLSVDGSKVEYTKRDVASGFGPYGLEITPGGDVAVVADIGNGPTGGSDTLQVIDLTLNPPRVVDGVFAGIVPEGIAMSPDGRFVAAGIQNGANLAKSTPWYHENGLLKIYALAGTRLTYVTEAKIGRWAQGLAWNRAGTRLLVQSAADNTIEVFGFDGRTLTALTPIKVDGAPTGIRTAPVQSAAVSRTGPAVAQQASNADETLIRARLAKYAEARDTGDAHAEALCYTEDGDFRSSAGPFVTGRTAIEKQLTVGTAGYRFALAVDTLRFVTADVAIAETRVAAGPAQTPAQLVGTYVLVRQGNDWLISAARIARVMPATR
jgi:uncharacterized protein (TIGR02246 family)